MAEEERVASGSAADSAAPPLIIRGETVVASPYLRLTPGYVVIAAGRVVCIAADEAKAESKAMAVWRIEMDEAARSSDHASLSAAVDEAELILAPFADEDGDEDIDTILSPQAKSQRAGHRDETNTRSKHPLVAVAARAAGNMGRREARLGDLLSALTGEMAASKRAEKEIGTLQKKVAELEMTAVAATRALEAERSGGGAFGASGGDDPPTPSAREVASMAVGLASSAKSRIRDAEDELITSRKTIESMRCEIQALESKLEDQRKRLRLDDNYQARGRGAGGEPVALWWTRQDVQAELGRKRERREIS